MAEAIEVGATATRAATVRRAIAFTLVILTAVAVLAASLATWAKRTVLETDRFTKVAQTLVADDRVIEAIVDAVTPPILTLVEDQIPEREDLPSSIAPLRPLLVRSLEGVVRTQLRDLLRSERGQEFVVGAIRRAHATTMELLDGRGLFDNALDVSDGRITLDLLPVVERGLTGLQRRGIIPSRIELPEAGSGDGVALLEAAFDKNLPDDFGTVVLYEGDKVGNAQESFGQLQSALALFRKGVVALWVAALLLVAGALALSIRRTRTLFQLGVAVAASMTVFQILVFRAAEVLPEVATSPDARDVAAALVEAATSGLKRFAALLILVGIVVAVAGYLANRSAERTASSTLPADEAADEAPTRGVMGWVVAHPDLARVACLAVALVLLFVWGLSWLSLVVCVGLAGIGTGAVAAVTSPRPAPG
ncbi:MAG: hypothetical protein KF703_08240 [Actinobacteria bacterium]|nr:hypothetical protein [Actinomycetota bacterium]